MPRFTRVKPDGAILFRNHAGLQKLQVPAATKEETDEPPNTRSQ
jgi:hypothetical protein